MGAWLPKEFKSKEEWWSDVKKDKKKLFVFKKKTVDMKEIAKDVTKTATVIATTAAVVAMSKDISDEQS